LPTAGLWRFVLIALAWSPASAWAIGARLLLTDRVAGLVTAPALVELAVYSLLVVFVTIVFESPSPTTAVHAFF